jgi:uncharacterized membrane protein YdbT with pleckstrin-like domain
MVRLRQPKKTSSTPGLVVRPTLRLVRPFYTAAFALAALIYGISNNTGAALEWLLILPVLLLIWTGWRHLRLRFTKLTITGSKLRHETGILSRSTRSMELSRIQDVRVEQSMLQRMVGIGNIAVETAGETGRLLMENVDNPESIADYILESARK